MAVLDIPADGLDPNYNLQVVLDGQTFTFQFRYNDRDCAWYFSVLDVNGDPIRSGVKMSVNFPLLRKTQLETKFPGNVVVVDTRADGLRGPPTLEQLGEEVFLTYVEAS